MFGFMPAAFSASRTQVIIGLCVPLAVLVGFLVAEPMRLGSMFLGALVAILLTFPLLVRWHHPLLIFSLNSAFYLGFLPGGAAPWLPLALFGFVLFLLNRSLHAPLNLRRMDSVGFALLILLAVILATMFMTGGFAMRLFGGNSYGGRRYIFLMATVMAYFVIASRRIEERRALFYWGLFCLSGLTALLSNLILMAGGALDPMYYVISPQSAAAQFAAEATIEQNVSRVSGFSDAANALLLFALGVWGMRGILDLTRPYRLPLVLAVLGMGMQAGFRSFFISIVMVYTASFLIEGLHRSRHALTALGLALVAGVGLVVSAPHLPPSIQRAISFLPVDVDPFVRQDAAGSTAWRLEMWRNLLPQVKEHLLFGKGYGFNPRDLEMAKLKSDSEWAGVTSDFHNGPLSILIPFGLPGFAAFGWFVFVCIRVLRRNLKCGDPRLRTLNTAILAIFLTRTFFFLFLVGDLSGDLLQMVFLVGLSVSLNGAFGPGDWKPGSVQNPANSLAGLSRYEPTGRKASGPAGAVGSISGGDDGAGKVEGNGGGAVGKAAGHRRPTKEARGAGKLDVAVPEQEKRHISSFKRTSGPELGVQTRQCSSQERAGGGAF
jgi:O-antigen ligase